ncbi:conserved hypothetical protein [Trichinella spiralis]|uniref:hypothetical protein n=1 Tax=Trichinella spiralis TaxID=6334 RepID=UPI0001EFD467|nr:conserved hypothetical protein [Trichinella spiralis]
MCTAIENKIAVMVRNRPKLLFTLKRVRKIRKVWKNPAALRRETMRNANRFNVVPSASFSNLQRGEYLYCPKEKEMAFGKKIDANRAGDNFQKRIVMHNPRPGSGAETSRLTIA